MNKLINIGKRLIEPVLWTLVVVLFLSNCVGFILATYHKDKQRQNADALRLAYEVLEEKDRAINSCVFTSRDLANAYRPPFERKVRHEIPQE